MDLGIIQVYKMEGREEWLVMFACTAGIVSLLSDSVGKITLPVNAFTPWWDVIPLVEDYAARIGKL